MSEDYEFKLLKEIDQLGIEWTFRVKPHHYHKRELREEAARRLADRGILAPQEER